MSLDFDQAAQFLMVLVLHLFRLQQNVQTHRPDTQRPETNIVKKKIN